MDADDPVGAPLFVLRRSGAPPRGALPFHPWSTLFFVLCCLGVVIATVDSYPWNSAIGFAILAADTPVYWLLKRRS